MLGKKGRFKTFSFPFFFLYFREVQRQNEVWNCTLQAVKRGFGIPIPGVHLSKEGLVQTARITSQGIRVKDFSYKGQGYKQGN